MNAKPDSDARSERIDILLNSASLVLVGLSGLALITMIGAIWGVSGAGLHHAIVESSGDRRVHIGRENQRNLTALVVLHLV